MTDRSTPNPSSASIHTGQILLFVTFLCLAVRGSAAARHDFSFADGRITCTVAAENSAEIPEAVLSAVPLAIKAAIREVGVPASSAHLTLTLKRAPGIRERLKTLFRPEVFAMQEGDEIQLQAPEDALKLNFRIAHEVSHWLVARQFPARPPLWLDEGLANAVGATAAATAARIRSQQLERPMPDHLSDTAYTLQDLTALTTYPDRQAQVAAFYWQAEALTRAIRKRLGKEAFADYLALLSTPSPPDWQAPLRDRWYFTDGDIQWLARQIRDPSSSDAGAL